MWKESATFPYLFLLPLTTSRVSLNGSTKVQYADWLGSLAAITPRSARTLRDSLMSAYGAIERKGTGQRLSPTSWVVRQADESLIEMVSIYHFDLTLAKEHAGLIDYLCSVFADEVEAGLTYPQEGPMNLNQFEAYFFAADVFIAVRSGSRAIASDLSGNSSFEQAVNDRPWQDVIAGFYYIKPNYPGRSSHICNAGFVIPPNERGKGYGGALAKSYVHYAPKLGYRASVFNLVFVNNTASIRLWERLGFTKAGCIPQAGRLKRKDGQGEEYVDAWVFYKSFVPVTE